MIKGGGQGVKITDPKYLCYVIPVSLYYKLWSLALSDFREFTSPRFYLIWLLGFACFQGAAKLTVQFFY